MSMSFIKFEKNALNNLNALNIFCTWTALNFHLKTEKKQNGDLLFRQDGHLKYPYREQVYNINIFLNK